MHNIYKKAGMRIRKLREAKRHTREKFAEIADISPKFLYEIEIGQKGFSADTLLRIAKGLSVTCEYILCDDYAYHHHKALLDVLNAFNASQMEDITILLKSIHEIIRKLDIK